MNLFRINAAAVLIAVLSTSIAAAPAQAGLGEVPASFTFTGSGWGHGVGMSQWGAYGMAQEGNSYDQIVGHYFPGTTLATMSTLADPGLNQIRVGIMQDGTSITLYGRAVAASGGGSLDVAVDGGAPLVFGSGTRVVISLTSGMAKVVSGTTAVSGSRVTVRWNDTTSNSGKASYIDFSGSYTKSDGTTGTLTRSYRHGFLDVRAIELANDGRVDLNAVIQQRLADEYIRGIGEVPSSWPAEALKAQAVAARSYALATVITANVATSAVPLTGYPKKVRAGCLCQVYATTADQNYVGYGKETATSGDAWVAAVAGTAPASDGQIVMSGSTVVKTFFSSSTGGLTQAVNEVWGSSAPWLTTVDDHWSLNAPNPNAAWSRTLSQASLVTAVNAALTKSYTTATSNGLTCSKLQVADIAVVSITDRYASRAVRELTFADSAGNTTTMIVAPGSGCNRVGPDRLRSMLGVKSTYLASASASTATVDPTGAVVKPLRKVSVSKWPSTLVNPSEYTFSGVLSPKQYGATVRLREKVGGSWVTLATTTTTITGRYRITWSAPAIGKHRLRITASNSKGSKSSAAKVVTVVGRVTFTAPSAAPHGTPVTLNGAVAPALPGVTLIIERRRWGTWRRVAVTTTNVDGTWRYELSTGTVPTSLKLRVRTIDPGIGRVSSRIRTIAIT